MEAEFIEKKKAVVEMEFDDKEIPVALASTLTENGVDAYWYDPHPLVKGFRLHVEADDAKSELKKAVNGLDSKWGKLKKELTSKLK